MSGLPIKIIHQSFVAITKFRNEGTLIENGYESMVISFKINKELFEDPKVNSKSVHLKPKYKVLFKVLIGYVVPKGGKGTTLAKTTLI